MKEQGYGGVGVRLVAVLERNYQTARIELSPIDDWGPRVSRGCRSRLQSFAETLLRERRKRYDRKMTCTFEN